MGRYYTPPNLLIHVLPHHYMLSLIHEPKQRAKHTGWSSFFNSYKFKCTSKLKYTVDRLEIKFSLWERRARLPQTGEQDEVFMTAPIYRSFENAIIPTATLSLCFQVSLCQGPSDAKNLRYRFCFSFTDVITAVKAYVF